LHSYSTDRPRRWKIFFGLGAIALVIAIVGERLLTELIDIPTSISFGVASLLVYWLFTNYIWKLEIVQKTPLVNVPDLNGRWEGHLYTSTDPEKISDEYIVETGEQMDGFTKMEAAIEIEQTWDKLLVTLHGPESPSFSHGATLLVEEGAWPTLTYNYLNEGSDSNEELGMHYGTTMLKYKSEEESLEGPYYTEPTRENHGILFLSRVD